MSLSPALKTLLESAQSQAKGLGHARVTTAHVALALLKTEPERASAQWGAVSAVDIAARCFDGVEKGDLGTDPASREPADVVELLEQASRGAGLSDLYAPLNESLHLSETEAGAPDGDSAVHAESVPAKASARHDPGGSSEPREGAAAGKQPFDPDSARQQLLDAVIAQDQAVDLLVKRLVLTRADLDLRPERPDGVFLFAGPTGVGKTELAKALGGVLFPDGSGLIRLDMSEYQDGAMSVAKLIGSGPGFVGHDDPSSWLTSRVIKNPNSVILLDEIEKAHPAVWTVFLQVFDDGRLTDGRGNSADFSNTVIVMTSNIGARQFESRPLGFGSSANVKPSPQAGVVAEIRKVMPPELFNRIDETVVFRALDPDDIRLVATKHIADALVRLAERGYKLDLSDDVVEFVAVQGFDPDLGARHLLRNVERLLLAEAAAKGPGEYTISVDQVEGALVWSG
jgi:ATP-dependent Clp protease ATP-binding subunit ClpA